MHSRSAMRVEPITSADDGHDRPEATRDAILDDAGARLMRSTHSPAGRSAALSPFRVLILNEHAQLIRFFYIECASTADALDSARQLAAGRSAEVWRNGERVGSCGGPV